jgi:hypothetical protein
MGENPSSQLGPLERANLNQLAECYAPSSEPIRIYVVLRFGWVCIVIWVPSCRENKLWLLYEIIIVAIGTYSAILAIQWEKYKTST